MDGGGSGATNAATGGATNTREIARHLEQVGAAPDWTRAVLKHVPIAEAERAEFFGEELPVGLRLVE